MAPLLPKIERGIHELRFNTRAYRKLEPENGWGGIASALQALDSIVGWLNGWERGWNGDIPIECIYMRW